MAHDIQKLMAEGVSEYIAGNFSRSIDILTGVLNLEGTHRMALMTRGAAFLNLDQPHAAENDFDHVIAMAPDSPRVYHLRGLARDRLGKLDDAMTDFNQAIDQDPEYGIAYHSRATLHSKMGHLDASTDDIETGTQLTEKNIETFANENNIWRSTHLRMEHLLDGATDRESPGTTR